jgi:hypothetical protein
MPASNFSHTVVLPAPEGADTTITKPLRERKASTTGAIGSDFGFPCAIPRGVSSVFAVSYSLRKRFGVHAAQHYVIARGDDHRPRLVSLRGVYQPVLLLCGFAKANRWLRVGRHDGDDFVGHDRPAEPDAYYASQIWSSLSGRNNQATLFNVLDLLTHLFQLALDFHDFVRDRRVARL